MESFEGTRAPQQLIDARLQQVQEQLAARGIEGLLVTGFENKGWLSGFTTGVFIAPGGAIVVTPQDATYVTSHVDYEECVAGVPHMHVVPFEHAVEDLHHRVAAVVADYGIRRLAIEAPHITVGDANTFREQLTPRGIDLIESDAIVTPLRMVKDEWEIEQIRQANRVNDIAFRHVCTLLKPGVTEWEISAELEYQLRKNGSGSAKLSFQSIVASGPNSALPHASVTQRKIEAGDFVKFDFGATWNGYCSDNTRTVVVGRATERQRRLYEAVLNAQLVAIEHIEAGEACARVNNLAMKVMEEAGFGDYIAHGLGHGIGLQVHEGPREGPRSSDNYAAGNVVTVEPGLYIPGFGGVRIEDDILVTPNGHVNLSTAPKALLEL